MNDLRGKLVAVANGIVVALVNGELRVRATAGAHGERIPLPPGVTADEIVALGAVPPAVVTADGSVHLYLHQSRWERAGSLFDEPRTVTRRGARHHVVPGATLTAQAAERMFVVFVRDVGLGLAEPALCGDSAEIPATLWRETWCRRSARRATDQEVKALLAGAAR